MPRARILNIVDMVPNKQGPVELQLIAVAREARAHDLELTAMFRGEIPDWFRQRMEEHGAHVESFPDARWTPNILAACDRLKPDLAHFHFGPNTGWSECARRGVCVVRSEHTQHATRNLEPLRIAVRRWRARRVWMFITVSEYLAGQTCRAFAVPRSRVRVVLNGTDIERFRPRPADRRHLREELFGITDDDVPVITIAANLRPNKRQALAVAAVPELLEIDPRTVLVLAGDGVDRAALRDQIERASLQRSVRMLTGENDVAKIYAASDIAMLPSITEGVGGAAIEALACGIPFVGTPNGGMPEVYEEDVSGVTIRADPPPGVAQTLAPLTREPALRARMGAAGRDRAEARFGISRPARETIAVYMEALSLG